MAESATIARPYAEALFQIAKTDNTLLMWSNLISEMIAVINNEDFNFFVIKNLCLTNKQVIFMLNEVLNIVLSHEAKNFIMILVENRRLELLSEIFIQFHLLKNFQDGISTVEIISAFTLSTIQLKNIVYLLEKKFKCKLHPIIKINSKLIGGIRAVVKDTVLDISTHTKLQQLYTALIK